jgi:putative glycosyltransferase (TIGR04372 family)
LNIISELKNLETIYYDGRYHEAVSKRIEIYQEIYEKLELDENYFPKKLSRIWGEAIGHEALIGALQICAKYNLVHNGKRDIDIVNTRKGIVYFELCDKFLNIDYLNPPIIDLSYFPSQFHKYENLMLWRTRNGFEDHYSLLDKVFKAYDSDDENLEFTFSSNQESIYRKKLKELGLPDTSWFVVIHIKETSKNSNSRRSASVKNFEKSCKYLVEQGGWIIQIGFNDSTKIYLEKNYIDLRGNTKEIANLQLFVMAKAYFYLGTITGLNVTAGLFKTPSLITNSVTLGRNTINYNKKTRYLPKTVLNLKSRRKLSLQEILKTREGFGEVDEKKLLVDSIYLIENSSEEIYQATKDFFNDLHAGNFENNQTTEMNIKLKKIRSQFSFASSGLFTESYIVNNPYWLTDE